MIIKASQRSHAAELSKHLLNAHDNEHVTLHQLNGFTCDDLHGALQEIDAISQGTKCKQPLFHASFNPPPNANLSTKDFEKAINAASEKLGLEGQPHAIVFHEKHGRRHAHCVWSRIDADSMTAINLPFYKNKMMELSKELYLAHDWKMPQGFIDKSLRNPMNYNLIEWQQARRTDQNPKLIKAVLQQCWQRAKDKPRFEQNLQKHGFTLAQGDKRGFVAVDWRGEVYSLSRQLQVKTKALKDKLGDHKSLPTVSQAKQTFNKQKIKRFKALSQEVSGKFSPRKAAIKEQSNALTAKHKQQREALQHKQNIRAKAEQEKRQARIRKGLRGFWDKLIGKRQRIEKQNRLEEQQGRNRDQKERDKLIYRQTQEQQTQHQTLKQLTEKEHKEKLSLQRAIFGDKPDHAQTNNKPEKQNKRSLKQEFNLGM